jgi:hypothetical protein
VGYSESARQEFETHERRRTTTLSDTRSSGVGIRRAVVKALGSGFSFAGETPNIRLEPPHSYDLTLPADVQRSGVVAVTAGDELRFFVRILDEGDGNEPDTAIVEAFVIGTCQRCAGKTALVPQASDVVELGAALTIGHPLPEHAAVCAAAPMSPQG